MTKNVVYLGFSPTGEDCAQVGRPDYWLRAKAECTAYLHQLRRVVGPEPEGAKLSIKYGRHDFGDTMEVVCLCDDDNEAAFDYALRCERKAPEQWDDVAREEIQAKGFCAIPGCDHQTVGCFERGR